MRRLSGVLQVVKNTWGDCGSAAANATFETVLERFVYRDRDAFRGWGGGGYHGKVRPPRSPA
jgi:hypothetical protein